MRRAEMVGARKQGATEPPFFGAVTEDDGSPTDLTGILSLILRLGTPGDSPVFEKQATITDAENGEWTVTPTKEEAEGLPIGELSVHIVINWTTDIVEYVPFDHYLTIEILKPL